MFSDLAIIAGTQNIKMAKINKVFILLLAFFFSYANIPAQKPPGYTSSELLKKIQKLNVLGTALYVAAHPDDENTRLIAYLSNHDLVETGYFSVTRGDGGQNLIGPEIREGLGVIRTQELLSARRVDGGNQFFSRGIDFGYSKHPDETFNIWDKDKVLADLVWVIRKFKPDVIISRFNISPGTSHGHHTASAMMAKEAFNLAGDEKTYPDQLAYVETWQPSALFWNTSSWFFRNGEFDKSGLIQVNVGAYDPILGISYTELAAKARSMHKTQGFGSSGSRGDEIEYMKQWYGTDVTKSLFENVDITWNRVRGGKEIEMEIKKLIDSYQIINPAASLPQLLSIRNKINKIDDPFWKQRKAKEIDDIIFHSLGLYLECSAADYSAVPGQEISISIEAINRSTADVVFKSIQFVEIGKDMDINKALTYNKSERINTICQIPANMPISQPYWLKEPATLGMFSVSDQRRIGMAENPPAIDINYKLEIGGEVFNFNSPLVYKRNDPVHGETYRPFIIIPPVMINIKEPIYIFPDNQPQEVILILKSGLDNITGTIFFEKNSAWRIEPESADIALTSKGEEQVIPILVYPSKDQSNIELKAFCKINGHTYSKGFQSFEYDHFPVQVDFPESSTRLVKLDIQKRGELVGYIDGAGDDIPGSLERLGYRVERISDEDINSNHLSRFDAIILGIRAYNTEQRLTNYQEKLLKYVEQGGTMIVQYNTNFRLVLDELAPYSLRLSRDRVTAEEAPVTILAKDHPVMNYPNKITNEDFDNWVQERGLYFPNEWDDHFVPVLSCNDPGESPKRGGLLVARYGKGYYIYTGYSWFRQLPAGVPGAYRIFTNLVSIGK